MLSTAYFYFDECDLLVDVCVAMRCDVMRQDGYEDVPVNISRFGGSIPFKFPTDYRWTYGDCTKLVSLYIHTFRHAYIDAKIHTYTHTYIHNPILGIRPAPGQARPAILDISKLSG